MEQVIREIRKAATSGKLSAFDAMDLANSLGMAVDEMPASHEQSAARKALIDAAFYLCLLSKKEEA